MDRDMMMVRNHIHGALKMVNILQVRAARVDSGPMCRGWLYATRIVLDSAVMAIEKASQFATEYEQRKTK